METMLLIAAALVLTAGLLLTMVIQHGAIRLERELGAARDRIDELERLTPARSKDGRFLSREDAAAERAKRQRVTAALRAGR